MADEPCNGTLTAMYWASAQVPSCSPLSQGFVRIFAAVPHVLYFFFFFCLWGPNYSAWMVSLIRAPAASDNPLSDRCLDTTDNMHLTLHIDYEPKGFRIQCKSKLCNLNPCSRFTGRIGKCCKIIQTYLLIMYVRTTASLYHVLCATYHLRSCTCIL